MTLHPTENSSLFIKKLNFPFFFFKMFLFIYNSCTGGFIVHFHIYM
jgi:hypothetical protein